MESSRVCRGPSAMGVKAKAANTQQLGSRCPRTPRLKTPTVTTAFQPPEATIAAGLLPTAPVLLLLAPWSPLPGSGSCYRMWAAPQGSHVWAVQPEGANPPRRPSLPLPFPLGTFWARPGGRYLRRQRPRGQGPSQAASESKHGAAWRSEKDNGQYSSLNSSSCGFRTGRRSDSATGGSGWGGGARRLSSASGRGAWPGSSFCQESAEGWASDGLVSPPALRWFLFLHRFLAPASEVTLESAACWVVPVPSVWAHHLISMWYYLPLIKVLCTPTGEAGWVPVSCFALKLWTCFAGVFVCLLGGASPLAKDQSVFTFGH